MYAQLDECVYNITQTVGHYDVMSHVDSCFLQIFHRKHYSSIIPRPVEFEKVTFSEVMFYGELRRKRATPSCPGHGSSLG